MLKKIFMPPPLAVQKILPAELISTFRAPRRGQAAQVVFAKRTANLLADGFPVGSGRRADCHLYICTQTPTGQQGNAEIQFPAQTSMIKYICGVFAVFVVGSKVIPPTSTGLPTGTG